MISVPVGVVERVEGGGEEAALLLVEVLPVTGAEVPDGDAERRLAVRRDALELCHELGDTLVEGGVLAHEGLDPRGDARAAHAQMAHHELLLGVVAFAGITREVLERHPHELVVDGLPRGERARLFLEHVYETRLITVLEPEQHHRVGHQCLSSGSINPSSSCHDRPGARVTPRS